MAWEEGKLAEARRRLEESLALFLALGEDAPVVGEAAGKQERAYGLAALASVLGAFGVDDRRAAGDEDRALLVEEALPLARRLSRASG